MHPFWSYALPALGASSLLAAVLVVLRVRRSSREPLGVLSSVLAAYRDGDYSIRVAPRAAGDPLALVFAEVTRLGQHLRERRLGDLEAALLLETVVAEIEVAILAFDEAGVVRMANPASAALLGRSAAALIGAAAADLGVADWLEGEAPRTLSERLPGGAGPWELRRRTFREQGHRHTLVVLADVGRVLREEERQVWQRLIRVLAHELNNSLAPIRSIAVSLGEMMQDEPLPADWKHEVREGVGIVASRAGALGRFIGSYARLAQLPSPRPVAMDVAPWVDRIARLEVRTPVTVEPGPSVRVDADPDQMDQLLINLVRNAVDATLGTAGGVTVRWLLIGQRLELEVVDDGPGLAAEANLFVPFFTTKPGGSGIGLVLCRQIAEAHGGSLALRNRGDRAGCIATLHLPLQATTAAPR